MGQGWEVGKHELGEIQFQLGDGNLVSKQPADLLGVPGGATPPSLAKLVADVAAIKVKLGM